MSRVYRSTHSQTVSDEDDGTLILSPSCPHCKVLCYTDPFDPKADDDEWPLVLDIVCWGCGKDFGITVQKPEEVRDDVD